MSQATLNEMRRQTLALEKIARELQKHNDRSEMVLLHPISRMDEAMHIKGPENLLDSHQEAARNLTEYGS